MSEKKYFISETKLSLINVIAMLAVSFFAGASTMVNAAIQKYIEAFPNIAPSTIRLVGTLPSLVAMTVTLFVGSMAGVKVKYRTLSITGLSLIFVFGLMPYFFYTNWIMILVFRVLLGVGVGCLSIRSAIILSSVPTELSVKYVGFGTLTLNIAGSLMSPVVGALADKNWRYSFLVYGLAVLFLILIVLFLKEPEKVVKKTVQVESGAADGGKGLPAMLFVIMIFQFIEICCRYPVVSGMASFLSAKNMGTAAVAGTIISMYTVGGACANLILSHSHRIFKKNVLAVFLFIVVIGLALVLNGPNVFIIGAGTFLCGFGYMTVSSSHQIFGGRIAGKVKMAKASTFLIASSQAAIFLSSYYIDLAHSIFKKSNDIESALFGAAIMYLILCVLNFLLRNKICLQESKEVSNPAD